MSTGYLAISYKCNERCSFCPCSKEEKGFPFIDFSNIKNAIINFVENKGIDMLVISGGEPTIHPAFFDIIAFATKECGLNTVILSNGEKYYDDAFLDNLSKYADISKLTAITTIHSQNEEEHEAVNLSKGSFHRSIEGLKKLNAMGVDVIIKHCITVNNYKDLLQFYQFIHKTFDESVTIQLCSIDYCGMEEDELEKNMMAFPVMRPYLENMFDEYLADRERGSKRYMYAINMPFCACDPYYWDILTPHSSSYEEYGSPDDSGNVLEKEDIQNNVAAIGDGCKNCAAVSVCPGTYRTAFEYYGDQIIKPYKQQTEN